MGGDRGRGGNIIGLLIVAIVMPIAATLIRLAISRAREFQADITGAKTSGNPYALASALEKLAMGAEARSATGGWVENNLAIALPLSGLTMNRWEAASATFIGRASAPIASFSTEQLKAGPVSVPDFNIRTDGGHR